MRENYSYGANTIRDGISIGTQRMINQIVSPAQIMDLEEMKCYLRLAAPYPITLLELVLNKRSKLAESFISNELTPDQEIENLVEKSDSNVRSFYAKKKKDVDTKEDLNEVEKVEEEKVLDAYFNDNALPDDAEYAQKQEFTVD